MEQRRIEHVVRTFCCTMQRKAWSGGLCGAALFALCFKAGLTLSVGGKGARASVVRDARMSRVVATRGVLFLDAEGLMGGTLGDRNISGRW